MNLSEQEFNLQIGLKIKRYRTQLKLSQKELADKLNMKHSTISSYEKGKISVPVFTLYQLATIFDVDIYDILPPFKQSDVNEDELYLDQLYTELLDMDNQSKQKLMQIVYHSLDLYKHKK